MAATALLIGAGLGAYSQYQQGVAAKQQAEASAAIAQQNAKIAEQQAAAQTEAARREAELYEERGKKLIASQIAGYGRAGVTISGSPLSVIEKSYDDLLKDIQTILREGSLKAGQAKSQAGIYRAQASQYKQAGKYAYQGGLLGMGASLTTGVSDYLYKKQQLDYFKKLGV